MWHRAGLSAELWVVVCLLVVGCDQVGDERTRLYRFDFEQVIDRIVNCHDDGRLEVVRSESPTTTVDLEVRYRGRRPPAGLVAVEGSTLSLDVECPASLIACRSVFIVQWSIADRRELVAAGRGSRDRDRESRCQQRHRPAD